MNERKKTGGKATNRNRAGFGKKPATNKRGESGRFDAKADPASSGSDRCGNDPRWYTANEQLARDAASLAFSNPLGGVSAPIIGGATKFLSSVREGVPGIMTFHVLSTPGISRDNSSPINVAARAMYSYVRHANSGHANYDSPDLMLYCVAVDSCYTAWAWMVRAYGTIMKYSRSNRYYAKHVVRAMGFDYDDLVAHIADFRAFINTFAFKLGSICVPNDMTYMNRHIWQMSHLWVDSVSEKAQTYMYVPANFWKYSETSNESGGELLPVTDPSTGYISNVSYEYAARMCNSMVAAILESEDMMIMSGDILKAYGADRIQKIATIPENIVIGAEYSPEVCSQFQNIVSMDGNPTAETFTIGQNPDTGALIFDPHWTVPTNSLSVDKLYLNMRKSDVSPDDVMVATRGTVFPQVHADGYMYLNTCGSDIVLRILVWVMVDDGIEEDVYARSYPVSTFHNFTVASVSSTLLLQTIRDIGYIEKFDWHPFVYISYSATPDMANLAQVTVTGDLDNYTRITEYEVDKMNLVALLSQFGHANMGAFVSNSSK